VVVTDYPDAPLIENLKHNISAAAPFLPSPVNIVAEGYLWGNPLDVVSSHLSKEEKGFDLVILSDLLFNHSEHRKLLQTVLDTLKRTVRARAVVFFSPHRPWLYEKDMAFFEIAREAGLRVMKVLEEKLEAPMFEEEKGVSFSLGHWGYGG
jgi:nicotinamide N-methyltransferase